MANKFVISDTHFGHTNCWQKFKLVNGEPLRPFNSTEEMDETMVQRWNETVKPTDTVYHLGDVVIARRNLQTIKRLNGRKILIRGNHDIFRDDEYREVGFEQIHGVRVFTDQFIFSHIPLHPDCVTDRFRVNVHGHLHGNRVMQTIDDCKHIDPRYLCVCVEQTDFRPISFDEVMSLISQQFDLAAYVSPVGAGWGNGSRAD
jgi:calcineurin-like phosphoesterase family protein